MPQHARLCLVPMKAVEHAARSSRISTLLGLCVVLTLAVALAQKLFGAKSANAPLGMAGAKFGWNESALRESVPGLSPDPTSLEPAYPRFHARVLVYDEPATCSYELAVRDTLSRVSCVLDA